MRFAFRAAALAAAATAALATPASAKTIKVGLIAPFSGPASIYGEDWAAAIQVFQKLYGDSVDGNKVEIIKRDIPGPDPLKVRALAQELVVKEGVQYLAGLVYSPNALALGAFANQAKVPIVIFNAATSSIIDKSQYFLRTSYTLPQISAPEAIYALNKGYKKMVSMVSDYAPGWDAEKTFVDTFEKNGGKVVAKIRVPLSTTDFVPYLQRAKAADPDAIFGFMPGGGPTFELLTAYNNSGMRGKIPYLGQGETNEVYLPKYGDGVVGLTTVFFYSAAHRSAENDAFKKALHEIDPKAVDNNYFACAMDGMHVIYAMIHATHGEKDGDKAIAAAKGLKWESIRGAVSIDPKTRDFIQPVEVREVEKDPKTGALYNKEIEVFPAQPDYGRPGTPLPTVASLKPVILK
ncbi:MAG TPA: ABC transporter substrate-binding protein [Hyphomicrobiales bacterium]|nr:ABC transporter substrate-binding protein [Hyphomicrobiales bacterium]